MATVAISILKDTSKFEIATSACSLLAMTFSGYGLDTGSESIGVPATRYARVTDSDPFRERSFARGAGSYAVR